MDADQESSTSGKIRKTVLHTRSSSNTNNAAPTTFFLKSEKEMERSILRGRKKSQEGTAPDDMNEGATTSSLLENSSFGVESLEETISSVISSKNDLSRVTSNAASSDTSVDSHDSGPLKRKAGNPVHPKIFATGQRIISSERVAPPAQSNTPTSLTTAESPFRVRHPRRESITSSVNLSQPGTPVRISSTPDSALPSTPRSGSPKSFRLSDEEGSLPEEAHNHHALSAAGDRQDAERTPQLVMPSLSMPTRRPFTEQGRQIGKAKIMVVGPRGVGKTSFIHSLFQASSDIVHVDEGLSVYPSQASFDTDAGSDPESSQFRELLASTRSRPSWSSEYDIQRRIHRRSDAGEGVLDRNLTFIDTPGLDSEEQVKQVIDYVRHQLLHAVDMDSMHSHEWISMLSGEGGSQIDAIVFMFEPACVAESDAQDSGLNPAQQELLQKLSKWTNLIPVIGKADTVPADTLPLRKQQILQIFENIKATPYYLTDHAGERASERNDSIQTEVPPTKTKFWFPSTAKKIEATESIANEPYAVSSALGDDGDVIEASVLMSSQYVQPLVPSELTSLLDSLFLPANIAKLRHISATKALLWRRDHLEYLLKSRSPDIRPSSQQSSANPEVTSMDSMLEDPSKVLVPHGSSSFFRSTSPSASDASGLSSSLPGTSVHALAKFDAQGQSTEPFRQVRLAKWAQDLQRSLYNERQKYKQMYRGRPYDWTSESGSEKYTENALVPTKDAPRPPRGHLGGELGIIDPRDPLGVLAFGQAVGTRGMFALQVAGSVGLLGAFAYWVVKNWVEVQAFLGIGQSTVMVNAAAVPPPTRDWLDQSSVRDIFGGWGKQH